LTEALKLLRVLIDNGCRQDGNIDTREVVSWCVETGMDENDCLKALVQAAVQGWLGATRAGTIRLLAAGCSIAVLRNGRPRRLARPTRPNPICLGPLQTNPLLIARKIFTEIGPTGLAFIMSLIRCQKVYLGASQPYRSTSQPNIVTVFSNVSAWLMAKKDR
jgi:hypothetical protein